MSDIGKKFVQAFGAAPDIIAAAPGRVNLIGLQRWFCPPLCH